ncbi:MAG: response regulator [Elusimicrobia bacterium]|nr:response regulator [Elusimicrobiota bacterium]
MPNTILVVDDDRDVREALKLGLEVKGYRVLTAGDGLEAVDRACADRPDFIILDFNMPGGGGTAAYEALRELRGSLDTPILFLTAIPAAQVKGMVNFRGRTLFLAKPAGLDKIVPLIRETLGA